MIGAYPPIADEEGKFMLSMEMNSLQKGININSIIDRNTTEPGQAKELKSKFYSLFNYIFNQYQVKDGELLLNYILDTLDNDIVERDVGTEIVINNINFLNGKIVNFEHFQKLLREYQNRVDDKNVMNIPWKDFFYFSKNNKETMIDCNFMSRNLANGLELEIDDSLNIEEENRLENGEDILSQEISCDMIDNSENDTEKDIYHIKSYDTNQSYLISGLVTYSTNAVDDSFKFIYDLKDKRIIDIEIEE